MVEINRKYWGRVNLLLELLARLKKEEYWYEENVRHKKLNSWYEWKKGSRKLPEC